MCFVFYCHELTSLYCKDIFKTDTKGFDNLQKGFDN